jgi:hypothetical protein
MLLARRSLLFGPAIVAAASLMPVRSIARLLQPPKTYVELFGVLGELLARVPYEGAIPGDPMTAVFTTVQNITVASARLSVGGGGGGGSNCPLIMCGVHYPGNIRLLPGDSLVLQNVRPVPVTDALDTPLRWRINTPFKLGGGQGPPGDLVA